MARSNLWLQPSQYQTAPTATNASRAPGRVKVSTCPRRQPPLQTRGLVPMGLLQCHAREQRGGSQWSPRVLRRWCAPATQADCCPASRTGALTSRYQGQSSCAKKGGGGRQTQAPAPGITSVRLVQQAAVHCTDWRRQLHKTGLQPSDHTPLHLGFTQMGQHCRGRCFRSSQVKSRSHT